MTPVTLQQVLPVATYAARAVGMGFQLCTIANDSGLMAMAAKAAVNGFRKEAGAVAEK